MTTRIYSDAELDDLARAEKKVKNPKARWVEKPKDSPCYRQRGFHLVGDDGERFSIYERQSLVRAEDFSCGIRYHPLGGDSLTLARYNGGSHRHDDIAYAPHIHRATQRAQEAGKRPEREAQPTDRYRTLKGALACLLQDYRVSGLTAEMDQPLLLS